MTDESQPKKTYYENKITLSLGDELIKRAKIRATSLDKKISEYVRELIIADIAKDTKVKDSIDAVTASGNDQNRTTPTIDIATGKPIK